MKKKYPHRFYSLIFILVIFNFACQKNDRTVDEPFFNQSNETLSDFAPRDIKVIDGHIKSLKKVNVSTLSPVENNVLNSLGSNWNLKNIETADYTFSNLKRVFGKKC